MTPERIESLLAEQTRFFVEELVDDERRIIPSRIDLAARRPVSSENMVNDLGDFIQYLYAADACAGAGFRGRILEILRWTFDRPSYRRFLSTKKAVFDSTVDTGDFLVGLTCMLHAGAGAEIERGILRTVERYLEEFYAAGPGWGSSLSWHGLPVPLLYTYSIYNDIEELIHLYETTGREAFLQTAGTLYASLERKRAGGLPAIAYLPLGAANRLCRRFGVRFARTVLSKTMSNFCSATICLARHDDRIDPVRAAIEPLLEHFFDPACRRFATYADAFRPETYTLGQNHPAFSLFVDYDLETRFPFRRIIDELLEATPGLPPHEFERGGFHLDSVVDFATLLLKLYERTGCERYLARASDWLETLADRYRTGYGFVVRSDRRLTRTRCDTKFQGLVLKPYILLHRLLADGSVFGDRFLYLLSRDR
jgi:hypothetical protein